MYLINTTNGAVSTISTSVTHIVAKDGVLYGSAGTDLVSFTDDALTPTVTTGLLQFDSGKSKIRRVVLGVDSGVSTVVHSRDGVAFPQTVRNTTDTDVEHAANAAYEARYHNFTVTFSGELDYIDLTVVGTRRQRGQNDG